MELKLENSIEIWGEEKELPCDSENFKSIHIQKIAYINNKSPKIKRLLHTYVKPEILNTKICKTVKGTSQENQTLTGLKLNIDGKIIQNIEYIPKNMDQPIFIKNFIFPFSTFIILGKEFDYYSKVKVTPYIEDIYLRKIDEIKIYQSILLTLDVIHLS